MPLYFSAFDSIAYDEFGNTYPVPESEDEETVRNSPGSWANYTPLDGSLMQQSLDALLENDKRLLSEIPSTTLHSGFAGMQDIYVTGSAVLWDAYTKDGYAQLMIECSGANQADSAWLGYTVPSPQNQNNDGSYTNKERGMLAVNSRGMFWSNAIPQISQWYDVKDTLPMTTSDERYKKYSGEEGYTTIIPELKFPGPHGPNELSHCSAYGRIEGNFLVGIKKAGVDKDNKNDPFSTGELVLRINETPIQTFYIAQSATNIPVNVNAIIPPTVTSGDLNLCYYNGNAYEGAFAYHNYTDNKTNTDFKIIPVSSGVLVTNYIP